VTDDERLRLAEFRRFTEWIKLSPYTRALAPLTYAQMQLKWGRQRAHWILIES
jgi:hypothetical protein